MSVEISIIIPTLNEETEIVGTLEQLKSLAGTFEIIVADGGSTDDTCELVKARGARLVTSERGRGTQMHSGALAATGKVLWFLHADSVPPFNAYEEIIKTISVTNVVGGNFALRFDGDSRAAAFMNRFYENIRHIGLLYGDSGIFVLSDVYRQTGGFKPMPLFEDLEFIGRLRKRGTLLKVNFPITTSSRRFENRPFLPVFIRWVLFQGLYWIGVSPARLARAYKPVRRGENS
ncbi:TIGR04283 family arsenosugar biosynthesis glycosyltransferase [soil metagenome]